MAAATLITLNDVDLLGPLLVAEIEAYLKAQPLPPTPIHQALPYYGQNIHQWDSGFERPRPTLIDRALRRPARPTDVTVREYLGLMPSYIRQHGWTQGLLWTPQGQVCLLGARIKVLAAGYGTPAVDEQARLLIGNETGMPIDTWNDTEGRRVCDIHALLQATATRIR